MCTRADRILFYIATASSLRVGRGCSTGQIVNSIKLNCQQTTYQRSRPVLWGVENPIYRTTTGWRFSFKTQYHVPSSL